MHAGQHRGSNDPLLCLDLSLRGTKGAAGSTEVLQEPRDQVHGTTSLRVTEIIKRKRVTRSQRGRAQGEIGSLRVCPPVLERPLFPGTALEVVNLKS